MTRNSFARGLTLVLFLAACQRPTGSSGDLHVTAAKALTRSYAESRMTSWKIRARAAGPRCQLLYVETAALMEDWKIEALQFGSGPYDVIEGGLQNYSRTHGFRGVVYRDPSGRTWTYGAVTSAEASQVQPCQ